MLVLKAFAANSFFTNNQPGVVSAIGELSTMSMTFSRERGFYKSPIAPDVSLITFTCADNGTKVQLSTNTVTEIYNILNYIYGLSQSTAGIVYRDQILQYLVTTYATTSFKFDSGLVVNNGTYYVPEWISWESKDPALGAGNVIKIWLADASFQNQYDDYEIVVIPPFDHLDNFFMPASDVKTYLAAFSPIDVMNRIQAAKNGTPETIVMAEVYNYMDPNNTATLLPSTWNLLIYGNAGNNIDVIQNTLVNYVLANSAHQIADWAIIMPDLFKHTEFTIVPDWNNYAIPDRTLQSGIYSPTINITKALSLMGIVANTYPQPHINSYAAISGHPYKSLGFIVVGSPNNRNNWFNFTDVFADYLALASTSPDFNRMSASTQAWATMFANMLVGAETLTPYSAVPAGMSKLTRNGILYLVSTFQNITYLVAAKSTLPV